MPGEKKIVRKTPNISGKPRTLGSKRTKCMLANGLVAIVESYALRFFIFSTKLFHLSVKDQYKI